MTDELVTDNCGIVLLVPGGRSEGKIAKFEVARFFGARSMTGTRKGKGQYNITTLLRSLNDRAIYQLLEKDLNFIILVVVIVLLVISGCAKDVHKPTQIQTAQISYQSYTCDQLEKMFSAIGRGWKEISEIPSKAVEISLFNEAKAIMLVAETKNCQLLLRDFEKAEEETENINRGSIAIKVCITIGAAAMFFATKRNIKRLVNLARNTCISLLV